MSLSKPVPRKHMHTRSIHYQGFEREDGLWDIEGHLIDTKTYPIKNAWRTSIAAGEPLHEMLVRVTVDGGFTIQDVEAVTLNSPFQICPDITPNYKALIGVQMGPGWRTKIRQIVGGVKGCTHITELLFPMATVAFQTMSPFRKKMEAKQDAEEGSTDGGKKQRPFVLNTCHAWATDSEVVKVHEPDFYTGPGARDKGE
jgi:hypothetical protein